MTIILASQSKYKKAQLSSLGLTFISQAPAVTEDHNQGLPAADLAIKLASEKAAAIQHNNPEAIIIGSDQVSVRTDGTLQTKPGTAANAQRQLAACSGQQVHFHSAVCLIRSQKVQSWSVKTTVSFRELSTEEIARYVQREQPLDCAGSFKAEALGIALFSKIESPDPSALIGLPLISLASHLRELGVAIP